MAEYKKPTAEEREKGIASIVFWGLLFVAIVYFGWQGKLANDAERAKIDAEMKKAKESLDSAADKIEAFNKKYGGR